MTYRLGGGAHCLAAGRWLNSAFDFGAWAVSAVLIGAAVATMGACSATADCAHGHDRRAVVRVQIDALILPLGWLSAEDRFAGVLSGGLRGLTLGPHKIDEIQARALERILRRHAIGPVIRTDVAVPSGESHAMVALMDIAHPGHDPAAGRRERTLAAHAAPSRDYGAMAWALSSKAIDPGDGTSIHIQSYSLDIGDCACGSQTSAAGLTIEVPAAARALSAVGYRPIGTTNIGTEPGDVIVLGGASLSGDGLRGDVLVLLRILGDSY
jgi:hypothetical protein